MNKHILVILLVLLSPSVLFAGGQSEDEGSAAAVNAADGIIEYFDGEVSVNGEPADFGMRVPFGAVVETGSDAYCEVVFGDKNIFRISESTIVEINLEIGNPEIVIRQGAVASLFAKLDAITSDEPFRLRTGTAVAGVRGTAFFIKVVDPDNTYICLCNGELELSSADGSSAFDHSTGHHSAYYFRNAGGETEITEAPMLYHTDEDMNSLAGHIGERINWYY